MVRVRSIVLIATLAMARKFIILGLKKAESANLFALAAAILALRVIFWLMHKKLRKSSATKTNCRPQRSEERVLQRKRVSGWRVIYCSDFMRRPCCARIEPLLSSRVPPGGLKPIASSRQQWRPLLRLSLMHRIRRHRGGTFQPRQKPTRL